MEVNILDLQRYWPILGYLPDSLLKNVRLVYVFGLTRSDVLLVTNDYKVFFYGSNENLIESLSLNVSDITEVKELSQKPIKGLACNSSHCGEFSDLFLLTCLMSGEVYIWGFYPSQRATLPRPTLIGELPKTVVKVACGYEHFLALTSDGMVYAWGDNRNKQIASELRERTVVSPRRISFPCEDVAAEIACGTYFSVVACKRGVFGWGNNEHGQLGENKETAYMPVQELSAFKNVSIQQIACGDKHILALDSSGVLFSCGNNSFRQLGLNNAFRFKEIAAYEDSSVGETLDGNILVWGAIWGHNISEPLKTPCRSITEAFALYNLGGMYKPLEISAGSENVTVAESIRKSFGNPDVSDFKIIVQDKEICVHKSILAIRSKYFERMFANNWSEEKMSCIKMDESYEGMSAFLKYLYTDEINVDLKVLLDVAIIAEKYCELNLVNLCLKQFESGLNQSNVAELYELTLDQRVSNFNDLCLNYASRCLSAVMASSGYNSWNAETYKSFFQHDKIKLALAPCD